MDLDISISEDNTDEIMDIVKQKILTSLEAVGLQAEANVKLEVENKKAVDTSRLLNSITHGVNSEEEYAYVGTNVEYAPYVEYGTSKMQPRPFLKDGVQNHTEEYKAIFESYLKNE